jgi:UDP:flavonoid glycosyltransferase YjiC (YdhE family)
MRRKKILFVGEAATLAHIARPLVLSSSLDSNDFEIVFACDPHYQWVLGNFNGRFLPLPSVGSGHFLAALARGAPVYDEAVLTRYVRDDLKLLGEVTPDVVVGDFRLSLSISARLARVPYVAISNCYWSPYWRPQRYTVPSLPLTRYLPVPLADALFQLARPIAFALHTRPLNRVRRQHGLESLGFDLRRVYTDADHVLYADVPELFPGVRLPSYHQFIGPLLWSPPVPYPAWWSSIAEDRPIVYVTMGSSGHRNMLSDMLRSLVPLNITVITATAGDTFPYAVPSNVYVAQYLPGLQAARRASLVICNGGAPTCHQALRAGVPVVGVASNLDQFLNMDRVVSAGAGVTLRADRFNAASLRKVVADMLSDSRYRLAAQGLAGAIASNESQESFEALVCEASAGEKRERPAS